VLCVSEFLQVLVFPQPCSCRSHSSG